MNKIKDNKYKHLTTKPQNTQNTKKRTMEAFVFENPLLPRTKSLNK